MLGVLAAHAGAPFSVFAGHIGVDLFFVMSGFLITTLLALEHQRAGRINFRHFWARRFLRLMPVYLLVVSVTSLLLLLDFGTFRVVDGWGKGQTIASLFGYYFNYAPHAETWAFRPAIGPLWSLCIEEQFYFVWPLICLVLLRFQSAARIAWLIVLGMLVNFIITQDAIHLRYYIDTRGLPILAGCAMALSLHGVQRVPRIMRSTGARCTVVGAIVAIAVAMLVAHRAFGIDEVPVFKFASPFLTAAFCLLIGMLWYGPRDRVSAILSHKHLAYLGIISYGMYVYHNSVRLITWNVLMPGLESWPRTLRYGLRFSVYVGLTILLAAVSYRLLETPFLRLKRHFR